MAPQSGTGPGVHLVVLVHGLWGFARHMSVAKEELESAWAERKSSKDALRKRTRNTSGESAPVTVTHVTTDTSSGKAASDNEEQGEEVDDEELVVMVAGGMEDSLTNDGIDICATRVAYEVHQEVNRLEGEGHRIVKFSITGYSMGGLISRYLVGLLHSETPSFFDKYPPGSFSTVATPHIGLPKYNTYKSEILTWLGGKLMARAGQQLWNVDSFSEDDPRPLLEVMADPESVFMHALEQFPLIQIFANAVNDRAVPYPTGAIETEDHFAEWSERGLEVDIDESSIIKSWSGPSSIKTSQAQVRVKHKPETKSFGLGPVMGYNFPLNYLVLLLTPLLAPIMFIMLAVRFKLAGRRSQRRLDHLSQQGNDPHPRGLSISAAQKAIRRMERRIENDVLGNMDGSGSASRSLTGSSSTSQSGGSSSITPARSSARSRPTRSKGEVLDDRQSIAESSPTHIPTDLHGTHVAGDSSPAIPPSKLKVVLSDKQLRMARWLNALPIKKYVLWYPDSPSTHGVILVRDRSLPGDEKGRPGIKVWAKAVASA